MRRSKMRYLVAGVLLVAVVGLAAGGLTCAAQASSPKPQAPPLGAQAAWIKAQKMRAIYCTPEEAADEQLLARLKQIGINTIISYGYGYDLETVKPAIAAAEKYGLHFFVAAFFRGGEEMPRTVEKGCRLFVREDGTQASKTGCPLDTRLWEATIFDRALPLAEYGKEHPQVAGFLTDIENYGAYGDAAFSSFQHCYCEGCLADFLKARNRKDDPLAIAPAQRKKWLQSQGLLQDYQDWQHQQVETICRSLRARLDAINPDFLLGALPDLGETLSWDMASGCATEKAPFMTLPESTYAGFHMATTNIYVEARQRKVPLLLLPGIWAHLHRPDRFASHAFLASAFADGYWIYEEFPFRQLFLERTAAIRFPLVGTPQDWCQALTLANGDIDRRVADPSYSPRLPLVAPGLPTNTLPLDRASARPSPGVRVRNQSWRSFVRAPWAGSHTLVSATQPGGSVVFVLPADIPPDRYALSLYFSQGPDCGIVQVFVGAEKAGQPMDCYAPQPSLSGPVLTGKAVSLYGERSRTIDRQRELGFRILGKNPNSSGYNLHVIGYRLESSAAFCKDWLVLGPLPNPEDKGLEIDYLHGWRGEGNPSGTYTAKGGAEVNWKGAQANPDGYLDFTSLFTDTTNAVAYAFTRVNCPEAGRRRIWVGSDDGVRMWVNGKEVLYHHVHRGPSPDQDYADLELNKGWNAILLAVDQGGGSWGLFLRVSDPSGDLKYSTMAGMS